MVSSSDPAKPPRLAATACTECQRRKQKCSREWPCNHCQARRIAHLCKFAPKRMVKAATRQTANETRSADIPQQPSADRAPDLPDDAGKQPVVKDEDVRVLGYLHDDPSPFGARGAADGSEKTPSNSHGARSQEMENALRVIPPKPYTDMLVQHFLADTNFIYYILYPPTFSSDYCNWWTAKANGQSLTPEFTCLLLQVCACSAIFLDDEARNKLESELGENIQTLSKRYHHVAKQLSSAIPPGKGGVTQVQQLFLNGLWFKTEALFIEAWHALSAAIHEAQELGMHRTSAKAKLSEFDREMRRRIWSVLYAWDWQMSLLLSRPFIINSNYCSFELPNLRLENADLEDGLPSPIEPLSLQCQLGQMISKIPGVMGGLLSPSQAVSIQQEVERWFTLFPPALSVANPDTRWDDSHNYILTQRSTLHVIGYMVILLPLKQCLTKTMDQNTISIEKSLQPTAVDCALKLLEVSRQHLTYLPPMNTNFHFAPFLIFDTAGFLCSAIIHDTGGKLHQREKVIEAIGSAIETLDQYSQYSKTSALCHKILVKLWNCLPLPASLKAAVRNKSPENSTEGPRTPSEGQITSGIFPNGHLMLGDATGANPEMYGESMDSFAPLEGSDPAALEIGMNMGMSGLSDLPHMDLGELGQIWDWDNLDLDLSCETTA